MKSRIAAAGAVILLATGQAFPSIFPEPDQIPPKPLQSVRADSVGPEFRTVVVTALNDEIFRVDNYLPGQEPAPSKTAVLREGMFTGGLIDNPHIGVLTTPGGTVATLDKATGAVTITGGKGKGIYDNGERPVDAQGRKTLSLQPIGSGQSFYGGGERGYRLNLAGDTLVMYNRQNYGYTGSDPRIRQMNITMPLLVAPEGYGILMDDYAAAEMVAASPLKYASESPSSLSYYFFASPEGMPGVSRQVADLTGHQDLPPFWSLGYITSKYG